MSETKDIYGWISKEELENNDNRYYLCSTHNGQKIWVSAVTTCQDHFDQIKALDQFVCVGRVADFTTLAQNHS